MAQGQHEPVDPWRARASLPRDRHRAGRRRTGHPSAPRSGGSVSTYVDQLASTFDRMAEAWAANDGGAVAAFFTDDASLINPFGQRADGRAAVAAMYAEYFGGMLGGTTTTVDVGSVRPVGADHAFVDAEQTITGPDG